MRITSWNINGYRNCLKRDFLSRILHNAGDFLCLQEMKISKEKNIPVCSFYEYMFTNLGDSAHGGVAILTNQKPIKTVDKIGHNRFDEEGRFLLLEYPDFEIITLYIPHGNRDKRDLQYKLECFENLIFYLSQRNKPKIIVGDFNIAINDLDLCRAKANQNNTMFTMAERQVFASFLNKLNIFDVFRFINKDTKKYTWWPYAYNARQRNIGWRIDYTLSDIFFKEHIVHADIATDVMGSDHCPIWMEISL
ncbi:exodeoxyribonuclease III [Bacteroidia bacterium]|nr:exodeoxyribonuclease III [Bacteroidia bacterium]